jgi:hypothetical protein
MANIHCMDMAQSVESNAPQAKRRVHAGWTAFLLITLFLAGLVVIFAPDAEAVPRSAIGFSKIGIAAKNSTPDGDRQLMCPVCGRPVCLIPEDLPPASPPDNALSPVEPVPTPVVASVRLPWARVPDAAVTIFVVSSFEPRGPPFVD